MTAGTATTVVEIQVLEREEPTPTGEPRPDTPQATAQGRLPARAVASLGQARWRQRQARVLSLAPRSLSPPRDPHIPRDWRNNQALEQHHFGSPQAPGALSGTLYDQPWGRPWPTSPLKHNSEATCLIDARRVPQCGNQHLPPISLAQWGLDRDAEPRTLSDDAPWAQRDPTALR